MTQGKISFSVQTYRCIQAAVVAALLLHNPDISAKAKSTKKSTKKTETTSGKKKAAETPAKEVPVEVIEKKVIVEVQQVPAPDPAAAPTAATGTETVVEKKGDGFYLTFGLGRSLSSKMRITKKTSNLVDGNSTTQVTTLKFASAPVFSVDLTRFNPGKIGFSLGAYFEQATPVATAEFDAGLGKQQLDTNGLTFLQFGGYLNIIVAGQIPYGFVGANFGSGTLTEAAAVVDENAEDEGKQPSKFKGELGGQAGLGLRLGTFLAIEGQYRITQYTKEDESLLAGRERSAVFMDTFLASVKLMLN